MHKKFAREGFTLIELTLSILFIAILSLAVALLIVNAVTAYRRGITLNQINDVGMELVDDMRMSVQSAQARSTEAECANFYSGNKSAETACEEDKAQRFSSATKLATVEFNGESIGEVPILGAFCTGSYSYIWNSGYFFSEEYKVRGITNRASLTYSIHGGSSIEKQDVRDFKLLRILDENQEVCKSVAGYDGGSGFSGKFDVSDVGRYSVIDEEPVDIMQGDTLLALYDLSIGITNESATLDNSLYSVSFILGTEEGGVNVNASGNYCVAPEDYEQSAVANFDYCAINKFNFVAQANGG